MRRALRLMGTAVAILALVLACAVVLFRPPRPSVPAPGVTLEHVTVVNPLGERLRDRRVVVREDRIERVERATAASAESGAAERAEDPYAGAVVLPGLIDLHVHHPPVIAVGERDLFALLFLAHGVTSVRDTGSALPSLLQRYRRSIERGARPGPRIFACGPWLDGDPPSWPGATVVRDAAEGRRAVREVSEGGFDCVKIYNTLGSDAVSGILAEAQERAIPVVSHVPWVVPLQQLRGVEVQHMMGFSFDWGGVSDAAIARYVSRSRSLGMSHTPTIVTFVRAAQLRDPTAVASDAVGRLLPRYYREILWRTDRNPLALQQVGGPDRPRVMKRLVAALHEAGVPVLAGTDTMNPLVVPGIALHEELHHLADAGLSLEEVWAAATVDAGEALRVPGLGRIAPGAPADLLIFREDPTRDLSALSTLEAVVARGRLYEKSTLDAAVAEALAHFEGFPYEPFSRTAASFGVSWLGSFGE